MQLKTRYQDSKGFTLVEVLLSSALMLAVGLGAFQLQVSINEIFQQEKSISEFSTLTAEITRKLSNSLYYDQDTQTASSLCSRTLGIVNGTSAIKINSGLISGMTLYEPYQLKTNPTIFAQPGSQYGSLLVQSINFNVLGGSQKTSQPGVNTTLGQLTLTAAPSRYFSAPTKKKQVIQLKTANIPLFLQYSISSGALVDCGTLGPGGGHPEPIPMNCTPGSYLNYIFNASDGIGTWTCTPVS